MYSDGKPAISGEWFNSHGATHTGRVRPVNEDRFLAKPSNGIWLVADGMGGHSHGDVAASMIVQAAGKIEKPASHLDLVGDFLGQMHGVNEDIRNLAREHGLGVMGSTVVGLLIAQDQFSAVWAGDSRLYLNRGNRMTQLTKDHSEVQQMIDNGTLDAATAASSKRKNVILHAVGVREVPYFETIDGEIRDGDIFVLCSDGLTAHLSTPDIQEIVLSHPAEPACQLLIETALQRGGTDNVTVVIVEYRGSKQS
ncbi:protein phosphatase 2C domain-containing protein [Phyllobacterium sp. YR531]|uniref:PP2C family protein-serine/threonine phosphatase n=1 Tax=Phyllobacterium sp. YR531 TaxID=1144343 RepID=UPI00026FC42D|nr:protein phosphatase 2C domain-containing protein [Phyllobacterium sp. YR531]EJM97818.1 serine/threonine protein phosphatase [Phyllobacterium sp. YR531]